MAIDNATTHREAGKTTGLGAAGAGAVAGFDPKLHWQETLHDGTCVVIRPIRQDDAPLERAFVQRLSPESRRYRFLGEVTISDEMIRLLTRIDYQHDMAFVALHLDAGEETEIGVSRFCTSADGENCECAVVVADAWQRRGLGTLLMRHLIEVARQRGIKRMVSIDSGGNIGMRHLAQSLGFQRRADPGYPSEVIHTLNL